MTAATTQPMTLADPLLSKPEVAEALRATPRGVEHLHRTGRLVGTVILGRLVWRRSQVEAFVSHLEERDL